MMTLAWAVEKPWRLPQTGLCILCTLAGQAMPLAVLVVAQSELVKAKARGQSVMTWHLGGLSLQDLGHQEPTNCLNKSYTNSVWKSQNVFLVIGLKHICIHVPNSYLKVTSGFPPRFWPPHVLVYEIISLKAKNMACRMFSKVELQDILLLVCTLVHDCWLNKN